MERTRAIAVLVIVALLLLAVLLLAGCQFDAIGPSVTMKVLHKGENNGQEHLSRSAGMTSRTGWSWTAGNVGREVQ